MSALDKLLQLRPVTYEWIHPEAHAPGQQVGFIAQEVERVFPGWVSENAPPAGDKDLIPEGEKSKSLKFPHDFNAYVVKALQEIVDWLRGHDERMAAIEAENAQIKSENAALRQWACSKDPSAPFCPSH